VNDPVIAASAAITATVSNVAPGPQGPWAMLDGNFGVGGGRRGLDGVDGTPVPFYATSGWERSIEAFELEYPIEYEDYRLLPDSGGPGQWRGACAIIKHIRFQSDSWLTVRGSDGFVLGPPGLAGGKAGTRACRRARVWRRDRCRRSWPAQGGAMRQVVMR
jgi:N-methylhydantoinase B